MRTPDKTDGRRKAVDVPLPSLLQHADLTQRGRPAADGAAPTARLKAIRRRD